MQYLTVKTAKYWKHGNKPFQYSTEENFTIIVKGEFISKQAIMYEENKAVVAYLAAVNKLDPADIELMEWVTK